MIGECVTTTEGDRRCDRGGIERGQAACVDVGAI